MSTSPWLVALKLFLPSWNFFNDFTAVPTMEFAVIGVAGALGEWQPLFRAGAAPSAWRVVFNPQGNLDLLEQTLVERAAEEFRAEPPREMDAPGGTYPALVRLARRRLTQFGLPGVGSFRFRLVLREPGLAPEVIFTSPVLAAREARP
jgi:hypothetical protein